MAERTHDPTAKKLREARAKGDVPRAPLVAGAAGLLVATALVPAPIATLARGLSSTLSNLSETSRVDAWQLGLTLLSIVAPIAVAFGVVAIVSAIAQGSLTFSPSRLAPDPSRLDPFGSLRNLFDKTRVWGAARGLLVFAALSYVLARALFRATIEGARATGDASLAIEVAGRAASRMVAASIGVAIAVAVLDVIVSRRLYLARMRMTREEVVREHKEGDGDPELKRRREELHHELMASEAITAVRDATVVVINPTHLACALKYRGDSDDEAPLLLTKGEGALAARIVEAARLYGVPIVRDVPVARALFDLEVGVEIPELLYEAVAEVLRAAWDE